jgi:hypothetical protein
MRRMAFGLLASTLLGCESPPLNTTLDGAVSASVTVLVTGSAGVGGVGADVPNIAIEFTTYSEPSLHLPTVQAAVALPGTSLPHTGNFTSDNSLSAGARVSLTDADGGTASVWTQDFSSLIPWATAGTFTLILTSPGTLGATNTATGRSEWLNPHGTFTATAPADTTTLASGSVNVTITF